jgi:hypothetical protein
MGDIVTCSCVLNTHNNGKESLYLAVRPDFGLRIISLRKKGEPKQEERRPEWEYEEKDGKLHLTPSLHCTDTGFHTDYNWSCDYERLTANSGYEKFIEMNPGIAIK